MRVVIIANGELSATERLRECWQRADLRIAADGGAANAYRVLGLAPQVVVGDLDSLDEVTRRWLEQNGAEFLAYPPAKDATDLELALHLAVERGAEHVTIVGALGGRVDQFIANVLLLTRVPDRSAPIFAVGEQRAGQSPQVVIADALSEMWMATERATIEGAVGDTVSLIPIDERVEGIVTENLEYPLRAETLVRGSTRGISNRLTAPRGEVQWRKGLLLIVHLFNAVR